MFKSLSAVLLVLLTSFCVVGRSAADFFSTAPMKVLPLLDRSTRLDMLDYFRYGSPAASSNILDGQARVTAEDSLSVSYETTKTATGQMAVLEAGSDTILMVISTVATPHPDSSIAFYDTSWKPLRKAVLTEPKVADWLIGEPDEDNPLPFILASAAYDASARTLTFTSVMDRYFALPTDYLRKTISYVFDGKKFKELRQ